MRWETEVYFSLLPRGNDGTTKLNGEIIHIESANFYDTQVIALPKLSSRY
jgi:hypothetical protein